MADTAKVIRLEPEVQRHVRARMARLPSSVLAFHDAGKKLLADCMVTFFEAADDALFDMADKAQSNQEQNVFFDSMREVRMQRKGIESRIMDTVEEAFARLVASDDRDLLKDTGELSAEALSLVHSEDLEQLVAVEATVTRADREYLKPLHQAASALAPVVPLEVNEKNFPFGPNVLCSALMAQIKRLDIDIKAKLELFKLFDRSVIHQLHVFYNQLINLLADQGLKAKFTEPKSSAQAAHSKAPASANSQLLQVLAFAQKLPINAASDHGVDVQRVLASIQQHRGIEIKLGRIEKETINLVHMMFRFILRDHQLAMPLRDLVCRLQIPILRTALVDSSFLTDKRHPARRFLNEFTAVALQWNGAAEVKPEDTLFAFMCSAVERIVEQKVMTVEIFKEALADFSSFVEKDRRRSAVLEKRTVDAEDGKARAEQARKKVADEVQWRTMAHNLPPVVQELVNGPWSNVLFVTGLKFGFDSTEWHEQLKVLTDLVWSVQPCQSKHDRQKLIRLIPDLVQRMRRGLDAISYNPFEVSELFAGLEELHLKRIRGEESAVEPPAESTVEFEQLRSDESDLAIEPAVHVEEVPESESLPENDPHMLTVAGFVHGTWFDLNHGSDEVIRCRLAAFIKPTGKYIFVSRSGTKVAEKTQQDLAQALKLGQVRTVDNAMLFDKALESVVSGLRKSKNEMPLDFN